MIETTYKCELWSEQDEFVVKEKICLIFFIVYS